MNDQKKIAFRSPTPGPRPLAVVIAGGGTGGHLYPGIALAQTFTKRDEGARILFVGARGMEQKLLPEKGFSFASISARGFVGKGLSSRIASLLSVPVGLTQAVRILRGFSPHLVIGIGGYASGPVLLAAVLLRIKRVILEPNLIPGLANKILAPMADLVVLFFDESRGRLRARKMERLGVPVRPEIIERPGAERPIDAKRTAPSARKTLLVLGGSQGAHTINRAMIDALPLLAQKKETLHVIHQTGKKDWETARGAYERLGLSARVEPFIHDMAEVYAAADLVVSRAGAGTLSELAAIGKPSLLIPFPFAKGHQVKNAEAFVEAGAAEMILDRDLTGALLAGRIEALLSDPKRLAEMGEGARRRGNPHAAEEIVDACYELIGKGVL